EVRGAYDLVMYNYGPDKYYASVHIEVPDTMSAKEIDRLTRQAEAKIYEQTGVILAGVGVYAYNTKNDEAMKIEKDVKKRVLQHKWAVQVHGFYLDIEAKKMRFDVVMSFGIIPEDGVKTLYEEIRQAYPQYDLTVAPDVDVSTTD
ncbi:MAG: cation transporter, partial [Alphaproteobacteria bacterium]|nr:cation transporter [Alphaproteobacteria bacterium]